MDRPLRASGRGPANERGVPGRDARALGHRRDDGWAHRPGRDRGNRSPSVTTVSASIVRVAKASVASYARSRNQSPLPRARKRGRAGQRGQIAASFPMDHAVDATGTGRAHAAKRRGPAAKDRLSAVSTVEPLARDRLVHGVPFHYGWLILIGGAIRSFLTPPGQTNGPAFFF